jgi:Tfp pilus assembly protein PilX
LKIVKLNIEMKTCLRNNQNGQALLIVLLGMAVVLTLVLSIVSRSVTDVSITKRDEESLRAFSAAEAGVEQALLVGTGTSGGFAESNSR